MTAGCGVRSVSRKFQLVTSTWNREITLVGGKLADRERSSLTWELDAAKIVAAVVEGGRRIVWRMHNRANEGDDYFWSGRFGKISCVSLRDDCINWYVFIILEIIYLVECYLKFSSLRDFPFEKYVLHPKVSSLFTSNCFDLTNIIDLL